MEFTIETKALKAINLFTAKKDIRYYLKGVYIKSTAGAPIRITASDGYAMATHTGTAHNDEIEIIIPSETIDLALKASGKAESISILYAPEANYWTIAGIPFQPIDGRYPDCQRLWAIGEPNNAPTVFNPEIYSVLGKAQKACGLKPYSFRAWSHNTSLFFDNGTIRGLIMGLRDTLETGPLSDF